MARDKVLMIRSDEEETDETPGLEEPEGLWLGLKTDWSGVGRNSVGNGLELKSRLREKDVSISAFAE